MLTAETQRLMSDVYHRYVDLLERSGIYDSVEFVKRAETDTVDEKTETNLDSVGLHSFFRCFPESNQDIAMVQLNPKLRLSHIDFQNGEYSLYNAAGTQDSPEFDTLASVTPNWTSPWFMKGVGDSPRMIEQLVSALSKSGLVSTDSEDIHEYLQIQQANEFKNSHEGGVDPSTGFFSDFYYTNWFKFTTRDEDRIKDIYKSSPVSSSEWSQLATETLIRELNTVDPDIVFVCGARAWHELRPITLRDELGRDTDDGNVTDVEGYLFETEYDWYLIPMAQKSYYDNYPFASFDIAPFHETFRHLASIDD